MGLHRGCVVVVVVVDVVVVVVVVVGKLNTGKESSSEKMKGLSNTGGVFLL